MLGLTSDTKPAIDPVAQTANTLHLNLAPLMQNGLDHIDTSKNFDSKAEAGAIGAARNDTAEKLALAGDIRVALAQQMPDGVGGEAASQKTSLGNPATPQTMMSGIVKGMAALGVAGIGGLPGAVIGAGLLAKEVASFVAAPPQHAALPGAGPSAFTDSVASKQEKKDGVYVDAMGAAWDNGFQVKAPAGAGGAKPQDIEFQRKLEDAAQETLRKQGVQKVQEGLAQATVTEQRLLNQDAAARKQADQVFGVDAPALKIQAPQFPGPRGPFSV